MDLKSVGTKLNDMYFLIITKDSHTRQEWFTLNLVRCQTILILVQWEDAHWNGYLIIKSHLKNILNLYHLTSEYGMNLKNAKYEKICVPDRFLSHEQQKPLWLTGVK